MGVARRNYWNYYPSLVQNRGLLSLGKCWNIVSSPKHTRDTDWGWGRITVPIINLAMHKKQQQATDKESKSVDKDPVLGMFYRHKEKPNHRRNLKLTLYQRWKLLPQIPNLSQPRIRLPTPHTNVLTKN